jgi:hypothetical protein
MSTKVRRNRICKRVTKQRLPCRKRALIGADYCFIHNISEKHGWAYYLGVAGSIASVIGLIVYFFQNPVPGFRQESAYRPFGGPDPCYMALARDDARLHVSSFSGDAVSGGVVSLLVDDVDGLHAELLRTNVRIETGPIDQEGGNREMYVKDADGNSIRFFCPNQTAI